MAFQLLADVVVIFHLAFVAFALLGGLLIIKWKMAAWIHFPAAIWAAFIEFTGMICPLTPLENFLRRKSGVSGYDTGFIEHYIIPILYPESLNNDLQIVLGAVVILINAAIYAYVFLKRTRQQRNSPSS
jgi:hypothetical protein